MSDITKDFVFQRGCVGNKDIQCFLTFNHDAATKEVPNGQLFILKNGKNWSFRDFSWIGVSLSLETDPVVQCYVLGRNGELLVGTSKGFHEEFIQSGGQSPLTRGPLQDIQVINHTVYAVGMGRQVYKRVGQDHWVTLEVGIPAPPRDKIVGFNALAGWGESEMYAVGWTGEIWFYDGIKWALMDSPTNRILRDVVIGSEGTLYACGKGGIVLSGKHGNWGLIDYEGQLADWLTMAWFKGLLYLGDGYSLYVLKGDKLEEISIPGESTLPIINLDSNTAMLLAIGGDCAFITEDGNDWKRLPAR